MKRIKISIVLPAYNEAENIEKVVTSLLSLEHVIDGGAELIIINDGSTDGTRMICQALLQGSPFIRCVHHKQNIGYGGALISGFKAARGEYVAVFDADGQFRAEDLGRLIHYIDSFDIVVGFRRHRADPLGRRLLGEIWTVAGRLLFNIKLRDLNCGLKIFKSSILSQLHVTCCGPGINMEIMAQAIEARIPVKQVASSHLPRRYGTQSGGSIRVILRALPELFGIFIMQKKGHALNSGKVGSSIVDIS